MSPDELRDVARVLGQSLIARAASGAAAVLRTAAARSVGAALVECLRRQFMGIPATGRVRMAGVLLLTANVVQGVLLQLVPPLVRPAALTVLRVEAAVAAVVLIVAAPPLACAWRGSCVRRLLSGKSCEPVHRESA
jgi:hypothetical protein